MNKILLKYTRTPNIPSYSKDTQSHKLTFLLRCHGTVDKIDSPCISSTSKGWKETFSEGTGSLIPSFQTQLTCLLMSSKIYFKLNTRYQNQVFLDHLECYTLYSHMLLIQYTCLMPRHSKWGQTFTERSHYWSFMRWNWNMVYGNIRIVKLDTCLKDTNINDECQCPWSSKG